MKCIAVILCALCWCYGQNVQNSNLHNGLTEKIGNFSIEILYHTSKAQQNGQNLIMSPITIWSVLAVTAEGATGNTRRQINHALRLQAKHKNLTRSDFLNIAQWLRVNTNTVELSKVNSLFVDRKKLPLSDFQAIAKNFYDTDMVILDFAQKDQAANLINKAISDATHSRIPKIVESSYFENAQMFLTSAVYFRGQWSVPFNSSSTEKMPFYDSNGKKTGEVNMMYNRHTYPFSNIRDLQARVIELEYGTQNRLSMLIMLPNPGVSLEDMFSNFGKVTLDSIFKELRLAKEEYGDDEIDCFIPRFKIESNLDMTEVLRDGMGIQDLFDPAKSMLPHMVRTEL